MPTTVLHAARASTPEPPVVSISTLGAVRKQQVDDIPHLSVIQPLPATDDENSKHHTVSVGLACGTDDVSCLVIGNDKALENQGVLACCR